MAAERVAAILEGCRRVLGDLTEFTVQCAKVDVVDDWLAQLSAGAQQQVSCSPSRVALSSRSAWVSLRFVPSDSIVAIMFVYSDTATTVPAVTMRSEIAATVEAAAAMPRVTLVQPHRGTNPSSSVRGI